MERYTVPPSEGEPRPPRNYTPPHPTHTCASAAVFPKALAYNMTAQAVLAASTCASVAYGRVGVRLFGGTSSGGAVQQKQQQEGVAPEVVRIEQRLH